MKLKKSNFRCLPRPAPSDAPSDAPSNAPSNAPCSAPSDALVDALSNASSNAPCYSNRCVVESAAVLQDEIASANEELQSTNRRMRECELTMGDAPAAWLVGE